MRSLGRTLNLQAMSSSALPPASAAPAARLTCIAKRSSLPQLMAMLDDYCEQHQVDPQCRHDLHLIAEEACVNVMTHAYPAQAPGPVTLQVQAASCGGRPAMKITIEDLGVPFDPLALRRPAQTGPLDELPIGGLGVHLIRQLSDLQHYEHDRHRGNVLTITKFLAPRAHG